MASSGAPPTLRPVTSPVSGCRTEAGHAAYQIAKRVFDIVVATVLILALAPLLIAVTMLVHFTSPGPVLFKQTRIGQSRRTFTCLKFRSMITNAEIVLLADDHMRTQFLQQWKLVNDPRVTPLGRVLRKTSLDELPQLWNVVRGDMSLVGPRPVLPTELQDCYGEHAAIVTSVRPGLTGLWQVSGRSSLSYQERVRLDVEYVRRRHFWFDALIVLRTLPAVFGSKHAR
jgi:lipopolysaccharide/colanic/teichoic acid biosynthesis glycosyltransferase